MFWGHFDELILLLITSLVQLIELFLIRDFTSHFWTFLQRTQGEGDERVPESYDDQRLTVYRGCKDVTHLT